MNLHDAVTQIAEIRAHLARTETFRGFRSATVGLTSLLAIVGGGVQAIWMPEPMQTPGIWLAMWVGMAAVSLLIVGTETMLRYKRIGCRWATRVTWNVARQFLPCVAAGGALTICSWVGARESVWMLPGLWSILFGLGVCASCWLLPPQMYAVAVYYLLAGAACILEGQGTAALAPWTMLATFGIGQFLTAAVLYWTLERNHD